MGLDFSDKAGGTIVDAIKRKVGKGTTAAPVTTDQVTSTSQVTYTSQATSADESTSPTPKKKRNLRNNKVNHLKRDESIVIDVDSSESKSNPSEHASAKNPGYFKRFAGWFLNQNQPQEVGTEIHQKRRTET